MRTSRSEGRGESQADSALVGEPHWGLELTTPTSWPELQQDQGAQPRHPKERVGIEGLCGEEKPGHRVGLTARTAAWNELLWASGLSPQEAHQAPHQMGQRPRSRILRTCHSPLLSSALRQAVQAAKGAPETMRYRDPQAQPSLAGYFNDLGQVTRPL